MNTIPWSRSELSDRNFFWLSNFYSTQLYGNASMAGSAEFPQSDGNMVKFG